MKHLFILLLVSILLKLSYFAIHVTCTKEPLVGNKFEQYIQATRKFDAYWYQKIAENGYPKVTKKIELGYANEKNFRQSEWAFFPFYPRLLSGMNAIFHLNYKTSAFILSLLFSYLSMVGMFWFGNLYFQNEKKSLLATLLLFCFPFSFYFSMFYTEALFFTFLIFSFIAIQSKKHFWLSFLLIPLVLLRPNGLLLLLPLFLYFLEQNSLFEKWNLKWQQLFSKKQLLLASAFLTGPIAFGLYCFYQFKMTGFPFAFSIAQVGWYREFMFPLLAFFRKGDIATQFNSVYTLLVIFYAIFIRKKLPFSLNLLIWISLVLPLCSGSATSMARFISIIFPLFLVFSVQLEKLKFNYILIIALLGLHFWSFSFWVQNLVISN